MREEKLEEYVATGRRKRAVASVRLRRGKGKVDVNRSEFERYFPKQIQREEVLLPLKEVGVQDQYDLVIRVNGGGIQGQIDAIRLGLARALVLENTDRQPAMKEKGFLTRDPRKRERKKYGLAGARKRFQFSKR